MALTTNGFRVGAAGASDLADLREYIQIEQDKERRQQNLEALLKEESDLMNICYELEGESFIEWYESDKVPASGSTRYRIELIKKRIADIQSQPHPVNEAQAVERGIDDTLRVGSEIVVMSSHSKVTVSRSWAVRHLNVDVNGFDAELDKAFGKGNWVLK